MERMCYVAADPKQPGSAWAACVDNPKYAKENAEEIASWLKDGANIERVPVVQAREMLAKWVDPRDAQQELLIEG